MTGRLEGKTAVVTAAGQGMGRATVLAFRREGARVCATDIDAGKLDSLRDHAGVTARKLDVLNPDAINAPSRRTSRRRISSSTAPASFTTARSSTATRMPSTSPSI